jgi:predicted RNA binding protein YcfA (HicA-like mRNA interferase family)
MYGDLTYGERVELHVRRGLPLGEARFAARRWDEALHPRGRRGQFIDTDANGNPREPEVGGAGLGMVGTRFPAMNPKQLQKMLRKAGFKKVAHKGSHAVYLPPGGGRKVVVPDHGSRSIPRGTLMNILGTAGVSFA